MSTCERHPSPWWIALTCAVPPNYVYSQLDGCVATAAAAAPDRPYSLLDS